MTDAPRIDPTVISDLIDLGPETGRDLVQELVDLFSRETPARLELMRVSLAARDWEAIARSAHAMRGSAGNLGAVRVGQLSTEIEQAATHGDLLSMGPLLDQLANELDFVRTSLAARLAAMG